MNYILLFGMPGGAEIIVILLVIIMFFGADKIPEMARMFGKGMREIKSATNDIQREIKESASPITDITDKVDIKKQVTNLIKEEGDFAPSSKKELVSAETQKEEQKAVEEKQPSVTQTVARNNPYKKKESEEPKEDNS